MVSVADRYQLIPGSIPHTGNVFLPFKQSLNKKISFIIKYVHVKLN